LPATLGTLSAARAHLGELMPIGVFIEGAAGRFINDDFFRPRALRRLYRRNAVQAERVTAKSSAIPF